MRTEIGLPECPDLFKMTADDGTQHWVLGISANGKARGLPEDPALRHAIGWANFWDYPHNTRS